MSLLNKCVRFPARVINRLRRLFQRDPARFLKRCRSLVHIGANEGQERGHYASLGLKVMWVEALPEAFERLRGNIEGMPGQDAVLALLTDTDGQEHEFKVASNHGASSSIYDFKDHGEVWPEIEFVRKETLKSKRMDTLMKERGLLPGCFDAAVLDVQGAEMVVLKGFGSFLGSLRYVQCEAADFEAYAGAADVTELCEFMVRSGFRLLSKTPFDGKVGVGTYFDLVFEKV